MVKVMCLGEAMIELAPASDDNYKQGIAGDTLNMAVYLKRLNSTADVSYVTAVGEDKMSDKLRNFLVNESLNTDLCFQLPQYMPGLYMISIDNSGERSFSYWRDNSAAKRVISAIKQADAIEQLKQADYLFYSGISLAVIQQQDLDDFWSMLEELRAQGVKIAFDPNFRAALWQGRDYQAQYRKALACCDLLLPGIEDLDAIFGCADIESVKTFLQPFNCPEVIVKNGPASVYSAINGEYQEHKVTPVQNVVDTTSAGDSFNGSFLAARLKGKSIADSVQFAAKTAGTVIQHKGAIIPLENLQKLD
ncbi:sugar kinase [Catenovulum sediminis]|uniref:Sugar kinase n=1 Tax=Catenovulum sediminis TaxID=1740262 RepID=A0ABV1RL56_9ALTE|nr:sugar kinase [Catenovulum sediminis]